MLLFKSNYSFFCNLFSYLTHRLSDFVNFFQFILLYPYYNSFDLKMLFVVYYTPKVYSDNY